MPASYRVIDAGDYADSFDDTHVFALDVLVGLSLSRKAIPSKYLYDERGSLLFNQITGAPEYYLTKCEMEILETHLDHITRHVENRRFNLIELGSGFSVKTIRLLEHFLSKGLDFRFVPIDISESSMKELMTAVEQRFPQLNTTGLVSDYFTGIKWLNNRDDCFNFVTFLGSSIGNFTHTEARFFLRNLWTCLRENDCLLIGFDLKKDIEMLLWAYNDRAGITREFNLNLLDRINRELGGHFDRNRFRHFGTYDVFSGAMESYLVSLERQEVYIDKIGRPFNFRSWEPVHIEYSYKYLVSDIETLAHDTGYHNEHNFFDSSRYFTDAIWRVRKGVSYNSTRSV